MTEDRWTSELAKGLLHKLKERGVDGERLHKWLQEESSVGSDPMRAILRQTERVGVGAGDVSSGRLIPVFKNTRVPIEALMNNLLAGGDLDDFLETFPEVSRDQAELCMAVLAHLITTRSVLHHFVGNPAYHPDERRHSGLSRPDRVVEV